MSKSRGDVVRPCGTPFEVKVDCLPSFILRFWWINLISSEEKSTKRIQYRVYFVHLTLNISSIKICYTRRCQCSDKSLSACSWDWRWNTLLGEELLALTRILLDWRWQRSADTHHGMGSQRIFCLGQSNVPQSVLPTWNKWSYSNRNPRSYVKLKFCQCRSCKSGSPCICIGSENRTEGHLHHQMSGFIYWYIFAKGVDFTVAVLWKTWEGRFTRRVHDQIVCLFVMLYYRLLKCFPFDDTSMMKRLMHYPPIFLLK